LRDFPTGQARSVLVAILLLTVFFLSRIVDFTSGEVHLGVDPSVRRLLPSGDEALAFSAEMERRFGIEESLILALSVDDVFTPENLGIVQNVSDALAELEVVEDVMSLATAVNIRDEAGDLSVEPFLEDLPTRPEEAEALRRQVQGNPLYAGNLVSRDGRATAFVVHLRDMPEQEFIQQRIDLHIAETARSASAGAEIWMTGPPHLQAATARLLLEDLSRIIPLALVVMAGIAFLAFRTLRGVVLPLTTILLALVWTLGVVAWLRVPLNLVTSSVPPLILTVGFAYAVHVMTAYYDAFHAGRREVDAAGGPAAWAVRHVALAVILTAVTTGVGFASLLISRFGAVQEFGWISLLGVLFTSTISLSFVPAVLHLLPVPRRMREPSEARSDDWFDRLMLRLGHFDLRNRRIILSLGVLALLVAGFGATRISVSTDIITNFPETHPIRQQFASINEGLGGANPFYVVVESDVPDAFVQPANLEEIAALEEWMLEQPEIGGATSLADYVKLLNRAFHEDDPDFLAIPERAALTKQLLFFGASDELERFSDSRYQSVNIHVRSKSVDSQGMANVVERFQERLESLPDFMEAQVTGSTTLVTRAIDDVSQGQVQSLSLAFLFIYAILAIQFTSAWVGFLALLPNVLPVALYFGILGLSGVTLNPTTGLVACIVLGIAVDDTIHFLTQFNHEARRQVDEKLGAVHALRSVGRPVTITTVGLCLGFLLLTTSELSNQVAFGGLAAVTLAFAWLVDVTFTPALCAELRIVTLWDALTFDLGENPQETIPAFRGLSRAQARIACLATSVRTIPAGTPLFRSGDPGDELYVLIDGELAVTGDIGGRRIELARSGRGDVVGEVALYYGTRTADVDAVSEVRALRLTRENLMHLRKRYPRIAAQLLWNLSEILAARIVNVQEKA
jgi:predicted RND superfamily exporter protein